MGTEKKNNITCIVYADNYFLGIRGGGGGDQLKLYADILDAKLNIKVNFIKIMSTERQWT